jgi:hypothetical protein
MIVHFPRPSYPRPNPFQLRQSHSHAIRPTQYINKSRPPAPQRLGHSSPIPSPTPTQTRNPQPTQSNQTPQSRNLPAPPPIRQHPNSLSPAAAPTQSIFPPCIIAPRQDRIDRPQHAALCIPARAESGIGVLHGERMRCWRRGSHGRIRARVGRGRGLRRDSLVHARAAGAEGTQPRRGRGAGRARSKCRLPSPLRQPRWWAARSSPQVGTGVSVVHGRPRLHIYRLFPLTACRCAGDGARHCCCVSEGLLRCRWRGWDANTMCL